MIGNINIDRETLKFKYAKIICCIFVFAISINSNNFNTYSYNNEIKYIL